MVEICVEGHEREPTWRGGNFKGRKKYVDDQGVLSWSLEVAKYHARAQVGIVWR